MYPAPFEYHAPSTVQEAVALLGTYQDDAKLIAGSQSLVAMMKLRLVQPKHVVDLRKVPGLTGISEADGALVIGALTTHRAIEESELVHTRFPMMAEAAGGIGDAQVRNMGTIGGSLAHADPAADWPAVTCALDASVRIAGARVGYRRRRGAPCSPRSRLRPREAPAHRQLAALLLSPRWGSDHLLRAPFRRRRLA